MAAYAGVCGFAPSQTLPFTYPHMLAFPLHMGIMTDCVVPVPRDRHGPRAATAITQHRPIAPAERLDVSATAVNLRPHAKGRVFDLVTTVTSAGGETVWESTSNYLRLGKGDEDAKAERDPFDVVARHRHRVEAARQPRPRVRRGLRATTTRSTSTR